MAFCPAMAIYGLCSRPRVAPGRGRLLTPPAPMRRSRPKNRNRDGDLNGLTQREREAPIMFA
jgi:hypothetical protein